MIRVALTGQAPDTPWAHALPTDSAYPGRGDCHHPCREEEARAGLGNGNAPNFEVVDIDRNLFVAAEHIAAREEAKSETERQAAGEVAAFEIGVRQVVDENGLPAGGGRDRSEAGGAAAARILDDEINLLESDAATRIQ